MRQLTYMSTARKPFTRQELGSLVLDSRTANATHGITGILLHHNGYFLQVLEGHETKVEALFSSIQRDPRHHKIKLLSRNEAVDREFLGWSMRLLDTGPWDLSRGMVGYNSIPEFASAGSSAKRCLRLFHTHLLRDGALG